MKQDVISKMDDPYSKNDREADQSALIELDQKEKDLNKLLVSGMEGYQPGLNMFGSNVFSSLDEFNDKFNLI